MRIQRRPRIPVVRHRKDALRWKHVIGAAGGDAGKAVDAIDNLINVGPYQLKRYRSAVPLHFGGELGELKVRRVSSEHIVAWARQMQAKGLS